LNVTEYTSLINNPNAINDIQSINLEKIVQEFPYFQSARALYLKGLYNQNSFKYNYALKITAAHTTDRSVLFDFITSETFTTIQKGLYDKKVAELLDITVKESEIFVDGEPRLEPRVNTIEESILTSIKNASPAEVVEEIIAIEDNKPEIIETIEPIVQEKSEEIILEKLELGKPLEFMKSEKHSFHEWLQLSKFQPIVRDEKKVEQENPSEVDFEKQKKNKLIDTFIKTNPKIPPIKQDATPISIVLEPSNTDNSYLMTETLARVYLEQKKYQKAIQAYEILILKYPEKSSFFADRILDIKNLQQNNN
jgi:tetratricopeptide (TPR) repeat protein